MKVCCFIAWIGTLQTLITGPGPLRDFAQGAAQSLRETGAGPALVPAGPALKSVRKAASWLWPVPAWLQSHTLPQTLRQGAFAVPG